MNYIGQGKNSTMTMHSGKSNLLSLLSAATYLEQLDVEQSQSEQTQSEQTQIEQTQIEQTQIEQTQIEQTRSEQTRSEQTRSEQIRSEQTQIEQTQSEQTQTEQTQTEQTQIEQTQIEQPCVDEIEFIGVSIPVTDQIEQLTEPMFDEQTITLSKSPAFLWNFNDFNNSYQSYIIYCIRMISYELKIEKKIPCVFLPSFSSTCIDIAKSYDQYDPEENSFDHALEIVRSVLKRVVGRKHTDEVVNKDLQKSKVLSNLKVKYLSVPPRRKIRSHNSIKTYLENQKIQTDMMFNLYDGLRMLEDEIEKFNFGEFLPHSELIRWGTAATIIGFRKGIKIDYRYLTVAHKIGNLILTITDFNDGVNRYVRTLGAQ